MAKFNHIQKLTAEIALIQKVLFILIFGVSAAQAGGDAAAGEAKAVACVGCHGSDGKGIDPNPPLAGLDEAYFVEQLSTYKSGARENQMMQLFAGQLSEQDMADLAAYFTSLDSE